MTTAKSNRRQREINSSLNKSLLTYTAMAGAAAACAVPVAAEVVYTPVQRNVRSSFFLDLNHDGINDFQIYSSLLSGQGVVDVFPAQGNRVVAAGPQCGFFRNAAAPLPGGAVIGPGKPFQASATCMAYLGYGELSSGGPWMLVQNRYLGFAFTINGKEHFGWARLSFSKFLFNHTAKIEGFAYETIPNKPIVAGDQGTGSNPSADSATLGALAAGAPARNSGSKEGNSK